MRIFHCDHCGLPIFFENVFCSRCGHKLAYLPDLRLVASLDPLPDTNADNPLYTSPVRGGQNRVYRMCQNYTRHAICNWAIDANDPNPFCQSCKLSQIIPDLSFPGNLEAWRRLEAAKRRVVYSLLDHGLPLRNLTEDPVGGMAFQFMSGSAVLTGHLDGVITVNIDEADDVERERRRVQMREPYRTLLGHFRHEVGHYYWRMLIKDTPRLEAFRQQFGDERADYTLALRRHYERGADPNWQDNFVSEYASVHPWEDWAETWAHYLLMTDTLETAAVSGLSLQPERAEDPSMDKPPARPANRQTFKEIIDSWFPLTYALNCLNRGMGIADAYPFVLREPAIEKLKFVHQTICDGEWKPPGKS